MTWRQRGLGYNVKSKLFGVNCAKLQSPIIGFTGHVWYCNEDYAEWVKSILDDCPKTGLVYSWTVSEQTLKYCYFNSDFVQSRLNKVCVLSTVSQPLQKVVKL